MGQAGSACGLFLGAGCLGPKAGLGRSAGISSPSRGPEDFASAGNADPPGADVEAGRTAPRHPLNGAGVLCRASLTWFTPLVSLANKRPLEEIDVFSLPETHAPEVVTRRFWAAWEAERQAASSASREPSLARAIVTAFWPEILVCASLLFVFSCVLLAQPFLIRAVMNFISDPEASVEYGMALAAGMTVCSMCSSILIANFFRSSMSCGVLAKTAITCAVFQHSMRLTSTARQGSSIGQTTNLMAVDTEKVYEAVRYGHFVWVTPLMTVAVGALLVGTMGIPALAGMGLIFLLWPLQFFLAAKGGQARKKALGFTDERVKFVMEVVSGIRVMKLCAWESSVFDRTSKTRQSEVHWLCTSLALKALTREGILVALPPLALAVTFGVQLAIGGKIDGTLGLMALGFLNTLRFPFNLFAASLAACQDAAVSCGRLQHFLQLPVLEESPDDATADPLIQVDGAVFSWDPKARGAAFELVIDALRFEGHRRIALLGRVASGKSSLIAALLGEMGQMSGTRRLRGRIAYMGQTPWIQNMSLRDNIVFGHLFDAARYEQVLEACCLVPDLAVLKDGDLTEIGERGINLSGGQKARVALARCLYAVAVGACDVVILDCPFDALDAPTGQRVFDGVRAIAKDALLLCAMSAQVHLLPQFDEIAVLEAGRIGLVADFRQVAAAYPELVDTSASHRSACAPSSAAPTAPAAAARRQGGPKASLIKQDAKRSGGVSMRMLMRHLGEAAGGEAWAGVAVCVAVLLVFILGQTCRVASDVLMVDWASTSETYQLPFLVLAACVVLLSGRVVVSAWVSSRASLAVHRKTFWRMLRAPVSEYFDVTTSGEIVNKFAKDLETGDAVLPETCMNFVSNSTQLAVIAALSTYAIPWFAGVLAMLGALFVWIGRSFIAASRDLKRLDGSTRSPVYNAFSETLNGLETIRAWRAQSRFLQEFKRRVEHNGSFFFAVSCSEAWVMARLESIAFTIIGAFAFSAVLMRGTVKPQLVGLAMVYAIQLTAMLQRTVQLYIMINQQGTALERVRSFEDIPQEPPLDTAADKSLPTSWPVGHVAFSNVQMRYRGGDLVLKGVSFTAVGGERVGICGRTGSGKSSLINCLFRIVELSGGTIAIDGVDIATLGLRALRSKLSIIPQEPVIFSGSLRTNLDPFGSAGSDAQLCEAMQRVGLQDLLRNGGLDSVVAQNGENLSQGQRQLLCVARVMVRRSRITVLDEATSSMDAETDRAVQRALAEHWKSAGGDGGTMLTVAHRLKTILDYDKILVLSFGEVVEFGEPGELLKQRGTFSRMLGEERRGD